MGRRDGREVDSQKLRAPRLEGGIERRSEPATTVADQELTASGRSPGSLAREFCRRVAMAVSLPPENPWTTSPPSRDT